MICKFLLNFFLHFIISLILFHFLYFQSFVALIFESAHALKCLAKRNCGELAGQILSSEIINYLLDLLRGKMTGKILHSPEE